MKHVHQRTTAILGLLFVLCVGFSACSSGGDSGGGGGGTTATTVSGTATSPGGQLAKVAPTRLQQFFATLLPSDAWAQAIGGFAPVPNANVFLVRITNAGVPTGVPLILAQTTTNAAGQYTLPLPPGVTLASDLVVQVTNAATPQPIPTVGTQNAPATQTTVNVNPISEEVLREVITFLGANPAFTLANFSAFELSELQRVINAAVAANPSLVGTTATETIANIQTNLAPALATTIPVLASSTNFITVLSTSLPNGTANVSYSQPILAIGNPGALSYAVTVGNLPTGLSINPTTGQIAGTPTVAGTFNFSVQVSLPASPPSPVTRVLSITLAPPAPAAVASLTPTAQTIQVNTQGSLTVTLNVAQLTDTTVTLSAVPAGIVTLPAGNSVQVLANQFSASFPITAGALAGTTQVTATIGGSSASADVTVSLAPPLLVLPAQTVPPATVGVPYSHQLIATGGILPRTWSPIVGPPLGLTLSPGGVLSGTPTTAGTPSFTVQVQDAGTLAQTVNRTLNITISPPAALNLTGTWITNFNCTGTGGTFTGQETLIVTQTGTAVIFFLQPGGGNFNGTLAGNTMTYSGSAPGYTESGIWTMQGANNFTKTSDYVNTDGSGTGGSCPGTGQRQ